MAKVSAPHTAEWFTELRGRNPMQAMLVERMIQLAGTDRCCSICGQTHDITDYIADEGMSVRLCDDCKTNQEKMYGAVFLPLT